VLAGICIALVAAVPAFADPSISSKRAEAQQVMARLGQLTDQRERAQVQYDASTAQLAKIQRSLRENRRELRVAKHNLKASQRMISQRVVALYTSGQESTLEVILGSQNLDDLITRMDNAKSVTAADTQVLQEVTHFRAVVKRSGEVLRSAHDAQVRVVAQRAAAKREIETKIGQEQQLYSHVKGEIAQLVQAQAARQLAMAREARARIAAAQQHEAQQNADTIVGVSAVTPESDTIVAPPPTHSGVVGVAMSQLGTPYVWAGAAPGGFDCSGLVMWAYAQVGVALPHSSYAQYGYGVPVSKDQLQPGDLVFFDGLGHVGIYIGGGQFVHAPHTGDVVKISSLGEDWYASTYVGARRIL
jgi:cell wall-associated NlpC family hydrolase